MGDPIVYGPGFSTYTRSARLALEEKGVAYHLEEINILEGAGQTPEHLARQPFGKVPAFEHDGFRLYETAAIMRYVDEAFDGPALQPADPKFRARMTQVSNILDSYGYPAIIGAVVMQRLVTPLLGGTPDETVIEGAKERVETTVRALEEILDGNPYLAGDALSLADLHLIPIYDYFAKTPEGEKLLAGTPNLQRWWQSVSTRPSVAKTAPQLG